MSRDIDIERLIDTIRGCDHEDLITTAYGDGFTAAVAEVITVLRSHGHGEAADYLAEEF